MLFRSGAEIDKGMRGVFVYNENTAKTIFLPIGKTGHGRRKMAGGWQPGETGKAGTQRYAGRGAYNSAATQNPIFADIYRRPGAIYWCEKYYSDKNDYALKDSNGNFLKDSNGANVFNVIKSSSFDINFYSMGFEGYSNGSISGSNSDRSRYRPGTLYRGLRSRLYGLHSPLLPLYRHSCGHSERDRQMAIWSIFHHI